MILGEGNGIEFSFNSFGRRWSSLLPLFSCNGNVGVRKRYFIQAEVRRLTQFLLNMALSIRSAAIANHVQL